MVRQMPERHSAAGHPDLVEGRAAAEAKLAPLCSQPAPVNGGARGARAAVGPCIGAPHLQRRACIRLHKGRCSALNCCMPLSLNRARFEETCSRAPKG
ncbi:hypothetical protein SJ05684_c26430 [Sinorhizobium sojae CCBAU 05684]|uniref:Uncharacterized protein n=1 Tax=Sinorhizobium sojae CCBAU 05684 TaxID=716928 RepID=A0A249PE22_9HYPH|nr:hypothetical protein SJ05684_c26430 [Sinorhizobium sojae CCBAU 05684]